ncbi:phage virion morphogenesis protein [Acinetobacter sp. YH12124]|uniref:phage virion morphogenesis protein n=1 Tax=Acinetobacter sp. YH12124 TaxID=2601109 RepID=UPI0015D203EC
MAFAITIKADSSPIEAILTRLNQFDADKSEMFNDIGNDMLNATIMRFKYQRDVDGNPWKVSWRARLQGGETGRNDGHLLNGMSYNVLNNGVEWGANQTYAHVFHYGAHITPKNGQYITFAVAGQYRKVKEVNIPSRTFLGINAEDEATVLDIVGSFIDDYILRGA